MKTMGIENRDTEQDREREDRERLKGAEKLAKEKSGNELGNIALEMGSALKTEIASTRLEDSGSGGTSEKAEFEAQSAPLLAQYQSAVRNAAEIENPEKRYQMMESAYAQLREGLESIRGTQEARDAKNGDDRKKVAEAKQEAGDRKGQLDFSKAVLETAKKIEIERKLAELQKTADSRLQLAERTRQEASVSAGKAREALSQIS